MTTWKQQAVIDASVEDVWEMLADPNRYSEYAEGMIEVTGVPTTIEEGSTFQQTGRGPLGLKATTTYKIERFDPELREIKMECQLSGMYSHWALTEAQGNTFADVEIGVDPKPGLQGRTAGALHTKRYLRRVLDSTLDGLRRTVSRSD